MDEAERPEQQDKMAEGTKSKKKRKLSLSRKKHQSSASTVSAAAAAQRIDSSDNNPREEKTKNSSIQPVDKAANKTKETRRSAVASKKPRLLQMLSKIATKEPSAKTVCPICNLEVPMRVINKHLDKECSGMVHAQPSKASSKGAEDEVDYIEWLGGNKEPLQLKPLAEGPATAGSSTEKEKEEVKIICITCQAEGHFSRDCPKGPYYEKNFLMVVRGVLDSVSMKSLLTAEELELFRKVLQLDVYALRLLIRLYQRRSGWKRTCLLKYEEIKEPIDDVTVTLTHADLVDLLDTSNTEEVLSLLSVNELKKICRTMRIPSASDKRSIINQMLKTCSQSQKTLAFFSKDASTGDRLQRIAERVLGPCISVKENVRECIHRVELLFFMNREHEERTLTTMALSDMGRIVYPLYTFNSEDVRHAVFPNRTSLLQYDEALQLEASIDAAWDKKDLMVMQVMIDAAIDKAKADPNLQLSDGAFDPTDELVNVRDLAPHLSSLPMCDIDQELVAGRSPRCPLPNCDSMNDYTLYFRAGCVLLRCLSRGVELMERQKEHRTAVTALLWLLKQHVFMLDRRGRWWHRLAINLNLHLQEPERALEVCLLGCRDPHVRTGHKLALLQIAKRICTMKKNEGLHHRLPSIPSTALLPPEHTGMEGVSAGVDYTSRTSRVRKDDDDDDTIGHPLLFYDVDPDGNQITCRVEDYVIRKGSRCAQWQGIHCEGSFFGTMFGIFFWDIIFQTFDGVFQSCYQSAPLDWNHDSFYCRRENEIVDRVDLIRDMSPSLLLEFFDHRWEEHRGTACAGVRWSWDKEHLKEILYGLGGSVLAGALNLLARDKRHRRGGLPDLLVWKTERGTGGEISAVECRFVEVKSDNDRLATKQQIWLHVLRTLGAKSAVCNVRSVYVQ